MNIICSELDNLNISLDFFNSIKLVSDELIKYLKTYKQITVEYMKKIQSLQNNFRKKLVKSQNPKIAQITSLTSKIINLIDQNYELLQLSNDETDLRLKEFDTFIKSKIESIKSVQKKSSDLNKSLINSYNEINKAKTNYLNSLSNTEEIINKFYSDQNKIKEHENGLGQKLNDNEYQLLKQQQKNQLNDMTTSVSNSKKLETLYNNTITSSNKFHDDYVKIYNLLKEKVRNDTCELSDQIKTLIVSFLLSFKNNYKQPLIFVDICVNDFNLLQEAKETEKIMNSVYKNDKPLKKVEPEKYYLKSLSLLKKTNYLKKEEDQYNNNKSNSSIFQRKKTISKLDDGMDEMSYISDESLVLTIKALFDNFSLIAKEDFNLDLEEGKSRTQKYILKIIANMNAYPYAKYGKNNEKNKKVSMFSDLDYKREELSTEEILDLSELLNIHENRIIFLQKMSDYRSRGKFYLCFEDYTMLSKFLNIIADKIKRDMDYHSAEMTIILSQTYFIEDGKRKKYLQESIKENKTFKDKGFWEEFLVYVINKEIMKTLNRDQKTKENKANSDTKFSNIVFAQLLTLIDNMFEFDVESDLIRELLYPKVSYYKLNESLKSTINDVIESKKAQKKIDMEERAKEEENKKKEEEEKLKLKKEEEEKLKLKKEEENKIKEEEIKKKEEENKNKEEDNIKKEEENTKKEEEEITIKVEENNKNEEEEVLDAPKE